jgi:hypothetical protein
MSSDTPVVIIILQIILSIIPIIVIKNKKYSQKFKDYQAKFLTKRNATILNLKNRVINDVFFINKSNSISKNSNLNFLVNHGDELWDELEDYANKRYAKFDKAFIWLPRIIYSFIFSGIVVLVQNFLEAEKMTEIYEKLDTVFVISNAIYSLNLTMFTLGSYNFLGTIFLIILVFSIMIISFYQIHIKCSDVYKYINNISLNILNIVLAKNIDLSSRHHDCQIYISKEKLRSIKSNPDCCLLK